MLFVMVRYTTTSCCKKKVQNNVILVNRKTLAVMFLCLLVVNAARKGKTNKNGGHDPDFWWACTSHSIFQPIYATSIVTYWLHRVHLLMLGKQLWKITMKIAQRSIKGRQISRLVTFSVKENWNCPNTMYSSNNKICNLRSENRSSSYLQCKKKLDSNNKNVINWSENNETKLSGDHGLIILTKETMEHFKANISAWPRKDQ